MSNKQNKKMVNIFIVLGVIGGILVVISLAGYRFYTGKSNEAKERIAGEQREDIKNEVNTTKDTLSSQIKKSDSVILDKIENAKDDVLNKQNEIQTNSTKEREKSTKKIIERIDRASKDQNKNQEEIIEKLDELKNPPKDPNGLYRDDIKLGIVKNFILEDDGASFTIEKISFDNPIRNVNDFWLPYQYKEYTIKFLKVESLVTLMPPGAEKIEGIILNAEK